jgi:hypothetical protein
VLTNWLKRTVAAVLTAFALLGAVVIHPDWMDPQVVQVQPL